MAKKNKLTLQFDGFADMAARLDELGGDLKAITEEALQASFDHVTPKLAEDIKPHKRSGMTEASLRKRETVEWDGSVGSINVGFDIENGGLPSVFLMYGTPRMKPDRKLYNDIYGAKTKKEIAQIQGDIFAEAIRKKMEG